MKKIISLILALTMLFSAIFMLTSCGEKTAMTLTVDGTTYTLTTKELDFLFPFLKWQIFASNGWSTYYDVDAIWDSKVEGETTFNQQMTSTILSSAKRLLAEKAVYSVLGSPALSEEELSNIDKQLDMMLTYYGYGKEGYYKKYWGYTVGQEKDYYVGTLRSDAIRTALFNENNGVITYTSKDKNDFYMDKYVAYQFIVIDMVNDVSLDDEGNRIEATDKDKDGNEVKTGEYVTTKITSDERKEEKGTYAEIIKRELAAGTSFESLVEKYSDNFDSHKYASAYVTVKDSTFLATTVQEKIADFEVGDYTEEGISVSNNTYVFFVKRVELPEEGYKSADLKDLMDGFDTYMQNTSYADYLKKYEDMVVVDSAVVAKYSAKSAYLTEYVNVLLQQSSSLS